MIMISEEICSQDCSLIKRSLLWASLVLIRSIYSIGTLNLSFYAEYLVNCWIRSVFKAYIDRQLPNDACSTYDSECYETKCLVLLFKIAENCKSLDDIWGLSVEDVSLLEYHLMLSSWFCIFHELFLMTDNDRIC